MGIVVRRVIGLLIGLVVLMAGCATHSATPAHHGRIFGVIPPRATGSTIRGLTSSPVHLVRFSNYYCNPTDVIYQIDQCDPKWAGYQVTSGAFNSRQSFSFVQSWFIVPPLSATFCAQHPDATAGFWVGLDGTLTVEQTGVVADCSAWASLVSNSARPIPGTGPHYYAWYEMWPKDPSYIYTCQECANLIHAGDIIYAAVSRSGSSYTFTLIDTTLKLPGWQTSRSIDLGKSAGWRPQTCTSCANASAEAIVEDPPSNGAYTYPGVPPKDSLFPYAQYGLAPFYRVWIKDNEGNQGAIDIGPWTSHKIFMGHDYKTVAEPSSLDRDSSGGQKFWVYQLGVPRTPIPTAPSPASMRCIVTTSKDLQATPAQRQINLSSALPSQALTLYQASINQNGALSHLSGSGPGPAGDEPGAAANCEWLGARIHNPGAPYYFSHNISVNLSIVPWASPAQAKSAFDSERSLSPPAAGQPSNFVGDESYYPSPGPQDGNAELNVLYGQYTFTISTQATAAFDDQPTRVALANAVIAALPHGTAPAPAPPSPTSPVVSPGYGTPADAVDGFYQGELAGDWAAACSYVAPAAQALCLAGTNGQGAATGHVTIGTAVISGNEALVPVTGSICAPSTPCVTNSDPSLGMPPSPSQFAAYYAKAVANGTSSSTTVISPMPCGQIGGKWYVAFG